VKNSGKLLIDTGVFLATATENDRWHGSCLKTLAALNEGTNCYTVESCLVETSFFLRQARISGQRLFDLLRSLSVRVLCLTAADLNRMEQLMSKYSDLPMDLADAALVAAAERHDITTVFTTDRRDFNVYRPRHTSRFKLLPAESP